MPHAGAGLCSPENFYFKQADLRLDISHRSELEHL